MIHFILGGARSGKSARAQALAQQLSEQGDLSVTYVATATHTDEEMAQRIAHHQQNRPAQWQLAESPLELAQTLTSLNQPGVVLIDCLTLWLNNHLFQYPAQDLGELVEELARVVRGHQAELIFVANEVGLGVIPMGEISRVFVDEAGRLNQKMASIADQVEFVAAGIPMLLKSSGQRSGN